MPEVDLRALPDVPRDLNKSLWDLLIAMHHNLLVLAGKKGTSANKAVMFRDLEPDTSTQAVDVGNIDDPSPELSSRNSAREGSLLVAFQGNEFTIYSWSDTGYATNTPYIVAGDGGTWIAIAGKYISEDVHIEPLTALRLMSTDVDKKLVSTILSAWISGIANEIEITDNGDGTVTIGIVDPLIVSKGGTGLSTITDHGIMVGSGTGAVTPLGVASNGQIPIGSAGADPVLATVTGTAKEIAVTNAPGSITLYRPDEVTDEKLTVNQELMLVPSSTINITAAGGITVTKPIMHIQGDGGAVTVTANPQIAAGTDGQWLSLQGKSDTNTVTLNTGNGLHLHGRAVIGNEDSLTLYYDGATSEWEERGRNFPESERSWPFKSPSGVSGTFYYGGYYSFGGSANDFNPSINFGTANLSYAAHGFLVQAAGAGGGTDTVIRFAGTSIDDEGNRTAADTEDLTVDDAGAAGTYYETTKKWIGQVSITKQSGPDLLCNYGFCKYWDNNNNAFRVVGIEVTWLGGANDGGANFGIRHHKGTGWTYNAGAAPTPPAYIADMNTDHNTEINIGNGINGAWKRSNLNTTVDGRNTEGTIFEVTTTANKAFDLGGILLRIRPN